MGISLLSPLYLSGLLLLGLPIAIHLFSRRRVREQEFSDIRFIREAITRRRREIELENRRLLLLRMAVIGLLALALAKPVLRTGATSVAGSGAKSSLVFVVDNSFSMFTSDNGVVRMDRARARIRTALGFYGTGDEVSLITASERPQVVFKRLDAGLANIEAEIERLEPSYYASDLSGGIRLAETILDEVKDRKRELYLITDMQSLAWDKVAFRREEHGKKDIDLFLLDVGATDAENLAVTGVRTEAGEEKPEENRREVRVTFQVRAFGAGVAGLEPEGSGNVMLREVIGAREEASVSLRPRLDQPVEQTFANWVREEGPVTGYGEVEPDRLPADNRRFFVHGGIGKRSVLCLEGNPEGSPETQGRPEGFYLRAALDVLAGGLALNPRWEDAGGEVDRADFAAYQLVLLVDVPAFSERSAIALRRYVEEGGRVLVFLGPRVQPDVYNFLLYPDVVPLSIEPRPRAPAEPARITRRLEDHPLFRLFDEENVDLSEAGFPVHWDLKPENQPAARALAWFSDGGIALLENQAGEGKVLVFTSSPGPPWNDLPGRLVFVPLVGELLGYTLAGEIEQSSLEVGETAVLRVVGRTEGAAETMSVHAAHPDGRTETLSGTLTGGSGRLFFDHLDQPGVYRFGWSGSGAEVSVTPMAVAVNLDPAESDLGVIGSAAALERLTAFRVEPLKTRNLDAALSIARKGRPIWDYVLLLVPVLLLAETIIGNRVRRAAAASAERGAGPAPRLEEPPRSPLWAEEEETFTGLSWAEEEAPPESDEPSTGPSWAEDEESSAGPGESEEEEEEP